jgi:hypothetical protein
MPEHKSGEERLAQEAIALSDDSITQPTVLFVNELGYALERVAAQLAEAERREKLLVEATGRALVWLRSDRHISARVEWADIELERALQDHLQEPDEA